MSATRKRTRSAYDGAETSPGDIVDHAMSPAARQQIVTVGSSITDAKTPSTNMQLQRRKSRRSGTKSQTTLAASLQEEHESSKTLPVKGSCNLLEDGVDEVETGILKCLRAREQFYQPYARYMDRQPNLNRRMRAILFDWMFEVCQEYTLKRETLHMALINVDRYLSAVDRIERGELQLIGVVSLFLSAKIEEIYPPRGADFVVTTDKAYNVGQIYEMETTMLHVFDWYVTPTTAVAWTNAYMRKLYALEKKRTRVQTQGAAGSSEFSSNAAPRILAGVPIGSVVGPAGFPAQPYEVIMERIDLLVLDLSCLQFLPSVLSATMLYIYLPQLSTHITAEDVLQVSGYSHSDLAKCMMWSKTFLRGFRPNPTPHSRQSLYNDLPPIDFYTMQQHHPHALEHYKSCFDPTDPSKPKVNCRLTVHQLNVGSYDYEGQLSTRVSILFEHHRALFADAGPLLFYPTAGLSTAAIQPDITADILIESLFPNHLGSYDIFCVPQSDLQAFNAKRKKGSNHSSVSRKKDASNTDGDITADSLLADEDLLRST